MTHIYDSLIMRHFSTFFKGFRNWFQNSYLDTCILKIFLGKNSEVNHVKWSASSRWSFGPNSAWESLETMTIGNTHPISLETFFVFRQKHFRTTIIFSDERPKNQINPRKLSFKRLFKFKQKDEKIR